VREGVGNDVPEEQPVRFVRGRGGDSSTAVEDDEEARPTGESKKKRRCIGWEANKIGGYAVLRSTFLIESGLAQYGRDGRCIAHWKHAHQ